MPTLHVVIPFYNEGGTLRSCVARVLAAPMPPGWTMALVIVDDESDPPDRRALEDLAREHRDGNPPITVLHHQRNRGKGAAVASGFDAVLAAEPPRDDLVIIQDADLEYDPADYGALMKPLLDGGADAVIGSRFGDHRRAGGLKTRLHTLVNQTLTVLSNLMTGYRLHDMECCYKVMSVELLGRVRPWMTEGRYGVEPQLVAVLARMSARVVEVPVHYAPRTAAEGKKIGWKDGVRALWVIGRERVGRPRG